MDGDKKLVFERIEHGSPAYEAMVELRQRVLRIPFGHPLTPEELAAESGDAHLVGYLDGALAACLVLTDSGDGSVRMRQVAVDPALQGTGIGRGLVEFSERVAREIGVHEMRLHARDTAVGFYDRLGYSIEGEWFDEIDIPHIIMRKRLD